VNHWTLCLFLLFFGAWRGDCSQQSGGGRAEFRTSHAISDAVALSISPSTLNHPIQEGERGGKAKASEENAGGLMRRRLVAIAAALGMVFFLVCLGPFGREERRV